MGVSLLTLCLAIAALPISAISATAVSADIVISEFRTRGPLGGNDEFIELQNISSSPVSIGGWKIKGSNNTGGGTTTPRTTIPAGVTLGAGCNYLVVNANTSGGYSGTVASDHTYTTGVTDDGGIAVTTAADVIVDQVGMHTGSAFKEGTVLAPFGSTNSDRSYQRKSSGGLSQDTDNNANDFVMSMPSGPRNRASCGEIGPSVTSTAPGNGAMGVARDASITITFNEPVLVTGSWYSISCAISGAHAATVSGGPSSFSLDPAADFAANESCTVTVTGAQVADQDATDPPDTMATDHSFTFTTIDQTNCGEPATFIHQIQGSGTQSGMVGQTRTVEGIVVGDYQGSGQFGGYYLQEEDGDADEDLATSEGIFIASSFAVSAGDVVRVTGTVSEASAQLTQISSVTRTLICPAGGTITATDVDLPVSSVSDLERYEGMLVSFDQRLTVTETFQLGRFGEVVLSANGRLDTPTAVVEPGAEAQALQAQNDRSRIVLDDADNRSNIDPTRYPQGGLSASNTLRIGDSLDSLVGVLDQRFGLYRIQPIGAIEFDHDNARPTAAPAVGGSAKVAAMNVLNFFTTIDSGPDVCGPAGGLDCRGADSSLEFERQRAKIIAALVGLDADIVGLMEIENNDSAAVEDLVSGLNEAMTPGTYAYIDTGTIGTDAIKVALIYKPAAATPVGAHAILDSTDDPRFIDTLNRPALAQTFDLASGGRFTVVVNHLKSKGSACPGDPDTGDGSGNCNLTRTLAAQALVDWLAKDPTGSGDRDVLVIGDLNAYAKEDPIDVFRNAGYTDLIDRFQDDAYSYVFQGQSGYLDHALASPTLAAQVTGANEWHVNADEPTVLDYNLEFKSDNHDVTLYAPDAYRSSDHDPLLVGLDLADDGDAALTPVGQESSLYAQQAGSTVVLRYTGTTTLGDAMFGGAISQRIDCTTGAPTGPVADETLTENGNDTVRWKTVKSWSGECRQLQVVLDSGTVLTVRFDFR